MAEFLLVHGSSHGVWCWHRLIPALAAFGHRAAAIDLPRHPGVTLTDQAQAILAAMPRGAILLGHSAGGLPITAAAIADPTAMAALVYLCAYAPGEGSSVASLRRAQRRQPLTPAIRVDRAAGTYSFDPAQCDALFYHDCPAEDRRLAAAHLVPEAIGPQETPVAPTPAVLALPRHYIRCTDDRAIPPEDQARMALTVPSANRFDMPTGHSPFFAAPERLAACLDHIAAGLPATDLVVSG